MKDIQVLDQPGEKISDGLDLHINRFIVSFPFEGQLVIQEKKSFNLGLFWSVIIFGAFTVFFGYWTVVGWDDSKSSEWIIPLIFGLFFGLIAGFSAFRLMTSKVQCVFLEKELIRTNTLGFKKTIPRIDVISVFVTEQTSMQNNRRSSVFYSVDLRMPYRHYRDGSFHLVQIEEKNSIASVLGGINQKHLNLAEKDALEIAHLIAAHWKIPVKI